ncbi:MAG: hypothetical protein FWC23_09170 [Chitinispirillia bacterium]|nr:hypothetical protein [Chitinispirillia bacterium]MCL2269339.1 hypothetical protein [Chitinispirillia bacterium]
MAFRIKLKKSVADSVDEVKSAVAANGGVFEWDGAQGRLEVSSPVGKIKGACRAVSGNEIEVSITDKPFLVSEGMIKGKIEEYLG